MPRLTRWIAETNIPEWFDLLRLYLAGEDIEGIVWWSADGPTAKLKKRDFGLPRRPAVVKETE